MRRIGIILALCLVICGCSAKFKLEKNRVWHEGNGPLDPSQGTIFAGKFDILWEADFGAKAIAPMKIGSQYVAVTTSKDKIRFYDYRSGKSAGFTRVKGSAQSGLLILDSLSVTVSSPPRNRLVCRSMHSGEELWKDRVKDIAGGSITTGNRVIVSSGAGGVICYDLFDGSKIWSFETDGLCSASPVVSGDFVILPLDKGRIVGISVKDGSRQYELTMPSQMASPVTASDKAYAVDIAGNLTAFDPSNGGIAWTTSLNEPAWSSPAADSIRVVVATRNGKVIALDNSNGQKIWEYSATDVIKASPAICGGFVVVGTLSGMVISLKIDDGRKIAERQLDGPIMVAPLYDYGNGLNERLFVATNAGSLFCFGVRFIADGN